MVMVMAVLKLCILLSHTMKLDTATARRGGCAAVLGVEGTVHVQQTPTIRPPDATTLSTPANAITM